MVRRGDNTATPPHSESLDAANLGFSRLRLLFFAAMLQCVDDGVLKIIGL